MQLISRTKGAALLNYHPRHLDRLIRDRKIDLAWVRLYPGAKPQLSLEAIEALKAARATETRKEIEEAAHDAPK